jgi:membrane protein implicated in regulation of membrane protease activity
MAIEIFVLGMALSDPADPGTPIGIILLPILLLTLGGFIAYGIAAICWMPLIFFWRKRGWLNGGRLHLLAFLLALAVVALPRPRSTPSPRPAPPIFLNFFLLR